MGFKSPDEMRARNVAFNAMVYGMKLAKLGVTYHNAPDENGIHHTASEMEDAWTAYMAECDSNSVVMEDFEHWSDEWITSYLVAKRLEA